MYVRNCKENAPIYMYYVASETPITSSVIVNCPDLAPPQYFEQVYAYVCTYLCAHVYTTGHRLHHCICTRQWGPLQIGCPQTDSASTPKKPNSSGWATGSSWQS